MAAKLQHWYHEQRWVSTNYFRPDSQIQFQLLACSDQLRKKSHCSPSNIAMSSSWLKCPSHRSKHHGCGQSLVSEDPGIHHLKRSWAVARRVTRCTSQWRSTSHRFINLLTVLLLPASGRVIVKLFVDLRALIDMFWFGPASQCQSSSTINLLTWVSKVTQVPFDCLIQSTAFFECVLSFNECVVAPSKIIGQLSSPQISLWIFMIALKYLFNLPPQLSNWQLSFFDTGPSFGRLVS